MAKIAIVNFNAGEITPDVDAREDIEKYTGGCRKCENMIPDVFGNATKRPGTEFITIGGAGCYFETPASDPTKIHIYTADQLQKVGFYHPTPVFAAEHTDSTYPPDGNYELMNDIDLSGIEWTAPIGSGTYAFSGTFDGRYFTISNLHNTHTEINHYLSGGLFCTTTGATIQRVILKDSVHTQLSTAPNARSYNNMGLFIGSGNYGGASNSTITDCYASGSFTSNNTGAKSEKMSQIAGFAGGTTSGTNTFTRCGCDITIVDNKGLVTSAGFMSRFSGSGAFVFQDCYAIGTITTPTTGNSYTNFLNVGGFIGLQTDGDNIEIKNCYSAVKLIGYQYYTPSGIGGFTGAIASAANEDGTYTACFWDNSLGHTIGGRTAGLDLYDCGTLASTDDEGDLTGVTKSTTTLMQTQSTFTDAGWDFTANTGTWKIRSGDYPRHQWHYTATECQPL